MVIKKKVGKVVVRPKKKVVKKAPAKKVVKKTVIKKKAIAGKPLRVVKKVRTAASKKKLAKKK